LQRTRHKITAFLFLFTARNGHRQYEGEEETIKKGINSHKGSDGEGSAAAPYPPVLFLNARVKHHIIIIEL